MGGADVVIPICMSELEALTEVKVKTKASNH